MNSVRFHQVLQDREVVFCYKGLLSKDLNTALLDQLEASLRTLESDLQTRKRVYSILIECLQNISHHSDKGYNAAKDVNSILVYSHQNFYAIHTTNIVLNSNTKALLLRLEQISSFNGTKLKEEYTKVLKDGSFSVKGTAGLGLIDIAMKANQKFIYSIDQINNSHSQFHFTVYISKNLHKKECMVE